jgi:hypothetical protein
MQYNLVTCEFLEQRMAAPRNADAASRSRRRAARKPSANPAPRDLEAEADAPATAAYIAQMTDELIKLAHFDRLDLLTYLLEMAKLDLRARWRRGAQGAVKCDASALGAGAQFAKGQAAKASPPPQNGFHVEVGVNFK